MKKLLFTIMLILVFSTVFVSCKKDKDPETLKIGLVTGLGTLTDRGFNQQAYEGLLTAAAETNSEWDVRESLNLDQVESNIAYFCDNKFDVIITMTYDASQVTQDAALAHPDIKFILLDHSIADPPANLACVTYQIDQVSFQAGFLAAWWADKVNHSEAMVGYVAGPQIPNILQFTQSLSAGIDYFNNQYALAVNISGAYATAFNDTLQGAQMAGLLIQDGADIIFACAGKTGNGALYQAKNSGVVSIGVDTDQYLTIPEVGSILLTSCMKRLDQSIYQEILAISAGQFHGGTTTIASLTSNGVELAPFHDFENQVPDSIRLALSNIRQGIINGSINTGWE